MIMPTLPLGALMQVPSIPLQEPVLIIALVVALVPPERRCWPAAGVTLVLSGVLLADLVYLRFFGTVIPLVAAGAAFQVSEIGGSIASLLRSGDWWLLPAVLVAGLGAAMFR